MNASPQTNAEPTPYVESPPSWSETGAPLDSFESPDGAPCIEFRGTPVWKRLLDILLSSALLIALSPLMLSVALFIKATSRGPVFFYQSRIGAGGRPFEAIKFRTMDVRDRSADEEYRRYVMTLANREGPAEKPEFEDRLIRGAKFLRGHSLDELPQLFNVLAGTMSLVGPRPDVLQLEDYRAWQLRRFEVLPGITGLWQVSGKNSLSFNRMIELDLEYIDRRSAWLDAKILLKTVVVVMGRDNG